MLIGGSRPVGVKADRDRTAGPLLRETSISVRYLFEQTLCTYEIAPIDGSRLFGPLQRVPLHRGLPDENKVVDTSRSEVGEPNSFEALGLFAEFSPQQVEKTLRSDFVLVSVSPT